MRFKRVYIEITNRCNLNCPFCVPHQRENRNMSLKDFKHILQEIRPFTSYIYLHVKGEPLLHPQVDEFIKLAFQEGFQINLTTNATLLKEHLSITKYLRQLNISLHATNSLEIVKLAKTIKDCIVCLRIWNIDKDIQNKKMLEEEFGITIPKQENFTLGPNLFLSQKEEFEWPSTDSSDMVQEKYCYGLINQIGILVDGTVVPCCLDHNGEINLGNILKEKMDDILQSERVQNIIEGFHASKPVEKLCKHCHFKE